MKRLAKRRAAVAKLLGPNVEARFAFGALKGRIAIRGNIIEPIDVRWNACSQSAPID